MFRDKKKALGRLEAELLREAELEEAEARMKAELEEAEALLDDSSDYGEETEETYHNYANRYGAYNSDRTDEDLEAYSREVYQSGSRGSVRGLGILAVCLLLAILGVLAWLAVKYMGVLS